jgi:hypothetical protein
MTNEEVTHIQRGDKIRWNDPDAGLCTQDIEVSFLYFSGENEDDVIHVCGFGGEDLECFAHELERI